MARDNTMRFTFSNVTAIYTVTLTSAGTVTATSPATAPANGTPVYFNTVVGATTAGAITNPIIGNVYYVRDASGANFNLAPVPGGAALTIAGTTAVGVPMYIGNLSNVSTSLGGRSGVVSAMPASNQWSVAYSDALNVGRFRDQQADQSQIATINSVVSSITGDPAVFGSTASGDYFLRASVGPAGMFGPNPCQIIVQGNYDAGTGTAAAQTDINWLPVSSIGTCPANGTSLSFTASGTTSGQVASGFVGTSPSVGGLFVATGGSGVAINTPFIVGSTSSGAYTLVQTNGTTVSSSNAFSIGLTGNFGGRAITLVANASVTGNLLQADIIPSVNDAVVFTAVSATTLSANTMYFVTSVTAAGLFTVSTTLNGTAATVTAVVSGTGCAFRHDLLPTMAVSISGSTFTSVSIAGGSGVVPHGLQVGSIVVLSSGTALTALALNTAYFVTSVPTPTTFTLSATQNGANITTAAATNPIFAVNRAPKIVNVQIGRTARQYLRAALIQQNATAPQTGYFVFNYADLSIGKDSAQVP
jgi:hypothetical protein